MMRVLCAQSLPSLGCCNSRQAGELLEGGGVIFWVGFLAGLQLLVRKEAGIWALAAGRVGTSLTCPGTLLTPQPFSWQCPVADGERKPKEQGKMLPLNTSPAPKIPWLKDFSRQECSPDVPY